MQLISAEEANKKSSKIVRDEIINKIVKNINDGYFSTYISKYSFDMSNMSQELIELGYEIEESGNGYRILWGK